MIKATKNGVSGIFSDIDWKSGQPQRYGWIEEGKEGLKTLPKEIINFIERRKEPEVKEVTKTKKNDNPKQKVGRTGKRKPKRVGKA